MMNGVAYASLRFLSVAPGADEPITALLDLAVDDVGEFWIAREAADQIGRVRAARAT